MKTCQKCYIEKERELFGRDVQKIDGLNSYCKECIRKRSDHQRNRDKEKYNKYCQEYREKHRQSLKEKSLIDYYLNWEKRRTQSNENYKRRKEQIAKQRAEKRNSEVEKEKNRIRQKLWRENNRSKCGESTSTWKKNNPQKASSHALVLWAVRTGLIKKSEECNECKKQCKTEGHHEDYSQPLQVVWLCKSCHGKKHKIYR